MSSRTGEKPSTRLFCFLILIIVGLMASVASVSADPSKEVVFRITGFVNGDPFSLGLQDEIFTATVIFDTDNLTEHPDGSKIFPVEWLYQVGPYQLTTSQAAINLDNNVLCDPIDPSCIFDGWQVVDELNPIEGQINGYNVVGMAFNFQDHDRTALDEYNIIEPLDLDDWEVHNGTIKLEGLEGEMFVEIETFTRISLTPVPSGGNGESVGGQLYMLGNGGDWGDVPYAGVPFHVMHGFGNIPIHVIRTHNIKFSLEVDGVFEVVDFGVAQNPGIIDGEKVISLGWGYNFPEGLIGEHVLVGHWYQPCFYAVERGRYSGPCPDPNEKIEVGSETITINFVD